MRKVVPVLALSMAMACLLVSPAHADVSVGGPQPARHGYVWDRASGVAEPPHIEASSYVIGDLETGQVLAAKDPHGHYRPASTLKTLTAITLIPRLDPAKKVRPSVNAVDASGSAVGMDVTWSYSVKDLFHGLLMQSGNDAAIALAEANGGLAPTLAAMNAEARRIRALDTVARTPNGLDDDPPLTLRQQHSSAYDLALIMKQGLTLPDYRKYVGARLYDWPAPPTKEERKKGKKTGGYQIGTHDRLLAGNRYPGMIGGKNGWTSHALGSFVGAATRDGHTIIISLMHAQSDFWGDARALLDWGFAERGKVSPVGMLVDPVPPPAKPKPKPAAKPAAAVRTSPAGLAWWKIGVPAAAGVAIIAVIALAVRRRPVPAGASPVGRLGPAPADAMHFVPPPGSGTDPATGAPPGPKALGPGPEKSRATDAETGPWAVQPRRDRPRDVKVAGSPLSSAGQSPPSPRETVPNPIQAPDDSPADTERTVRDVPPSAEPGTAQPGTEPTCPEPIFPEPTSAEPDDGTEPGDREVTTDPWALPYHPARRGAERGPFEPLDRPDPDADRAARTGSPDSEVTGPEETTRRDEGSGGQNGGEESAGRGS